jgi:hypothetical protein
MVAAIVSIVTIIILSLDFILHRIIVYIFPERTTVEASQFALIFDMKMKVI